MRAACSVYVPLPPAPAKTTQPWSYYGRFWEGHKESFCACTISIQTGPLCAVQCFLVVNPRNVSIQKLVGCDGKQTGCISCCYLVMCVHVICFAWAQRSGLPDEIGGSNSKQSAFCSFEPY